MSVNLPTRQLVSHSEHSMVERPDVPRSRFVRMKTRKQTMNAGLVVPFYWEEFLPGDHLKFDVTAMMRLPTLLFPMFSNVKADVFFFAVPNRLVWNEWERFMGQQDTPSQSIDVLHPFIEFGGAGPGSIAVGSLGDYMGIPAGITQALQVNALPFRAYVDVWNEWFRDQNLQDAIANPTGSGNQGIPTNFPLPRGKFHDYFTTTLPWTQKFTAPTVPISGTAPVRGIAINAQVNQGPFNGWDTSGSVNWPQARTTFGAVRLNAGSTLPDVFADLTQATGVSINQLRQAIQIQRLLERDARGGTRYAELVLAHFGVRPPDFRVQRPEYIGGGSGMVTVTPVAQTATGGGGLGALGAAATGVVRARASYAATEHGIIVGLISVRPEQAYWQGVRRGFLRRTRYDYYWPSLSQLGEQAITRREIFATGVPANDDVTFGFQERYAEYRMSYSDVAGRFKPGVAGTLAAWHLAENFAAAPVLGDTFIRTDQVAFDRVFAGGQALTRDVNAQVITDILIEEDFTRPLPMFGTPTGMGRF